MRFKLTIFSLIFFLSPAIWAVSPTEAAQRIASLSPSFEHLQSLGKLNPRLVDGTCVSFALHSLLAERDSKMKYEDVAEFSQNNFWTLGTGNRGVLSSVAGLIPLWGIPKVAQHFGLELEGDWLGRFTGNYPELLARWLDEGRGVLASVKASRLYKLQIYSDNPDLARLNDEHVVRVAAVKRDESGAPDVFYLIDINRGDQVTAVPASHLTDASRNAAGLPMVAWRTMDTLPNSIK